MNFLINSFEELIELCNIHRHLLFNTTGMDVSPEFINIDFRSWPGFFGAICDLSTLCELKAC